MVTAVARPLEDADSALQNVEVARVTSRSVRGSAQIQFSFPEHGYGIALQLVQTKVTQVQPELPPGITSMCNA